MGAQAVVSYRRATRHVQENIDLEMQLAQEKLRFVLYDAYDVAIRLEGFIEDEMRQPDDLLEETKAIVNHYPQFYTSYVAFPEYRYPEKGKWCSPCSYRVRDSIFTTIFGDERHDYFTREWYQGALDSGDEGFWSHPYHDEDFDETIFTYSEDMRDKQGNLICVIASDFSLSWLQQLLDRCKPFDEAVFVLYSSDGEELAVSGQQSAISNQQSAVSLNSGNWLLSRKTLEPINIDLVMAVPRSFVWAGIRWGIWLPFVVLVLGIIIVGVLIRRLLRDREESAKLELLQRDMQIAHDIQMGILKGERGKVKGEMDGDAEIYAELIPMREVGGDLYDFHREGDNLWFIIGDVSGKGVPAAMFMSATVNLFRAAGRRLDSPKAIMEEMNFVLSDNNPSLTFVTAFIGRLHIPSGQLLYCNAGHCEPIIANANAKSLNCEPNIPLGYNGNYSFVEQGCVLGEGETLVLYTDGVTEARNADRKMLGKQRWSEMVAQGGDLMDAVKAFIGNAEPNDDITLMTIRKQTAVQPFVLRVPARDDQWPMLRRTIQESCMCAGLDKRTLKKLIVAAEEAVANVMHYSGATEIELAVSCQHSAFSMQLTDNGQPFDPTAYETKADAVAERQIGGMGISLIRQIVDQMHYQRIGDTNQLILIKNI